MKLKMYSIYDKVAAVFNKPFVEVNHPSAIRSFDHSIKENPHLEDYDLYFLAEYDDQNGELISVNAECIRKGLDVKAVSLGSDVAESLRFQAQ